METLFSKSHIIIIYFVASLFFLYSFLIVFYYIIQDGLELVNLLP